MELKALEYPRLIKRDITITLVDSNKYYFTTPNFRNYPNKSIEFIYNSAVYTGTFKKSMDNSLSDIYYIETPIPIGAVITEIFSIYENFVISEDYKIGTLQDNIDNLSTVTEGVYSGKDSQIKTDLEGSYSLLNSFEKAKIKGQELLVINDNQILLDNNFQEVLKIRENTKSQIILSSVDGYLKININYDKDNLGIYSEIIDNTFETEDALSISFEVDAYQEANVSFLKIFFKYPGILLPAETKDFLFLFSVVELDQLITPISGTIISTPELINGLTELLLLDNILSFNSVRIREYADGASKANIDGSNIETIEFNENLSSLSIDVNTTIYVNKDTGNDLTGDGSIGLPYQTLEYAISLYKYYTLNAKLTITIQASATNYIVNWQLIKEYLLTIDSTTNPENSLILVGEFVEVHQDVTFTQIGNSSFEYNIDLATTSDHELKGLCVKIGTDYSFISDSYNTGETIISPKTHATPGLYSIYKQGTVLESLNNDSLDFEHQYARDSILTVFKNLRIESNATGNLYVKNKLVNTYFICMDVSATSTILQTRTNRQLITSNVMFERYWLLLDYEVKLKRTVVYGDITRTKRCELDIAGGNTHEGCLTMLETNYGLNVSSIGSFLIGGFFATFCNTYFRNVDYLFQLSTETSRLIFGAFNSSLPYEFKGIQEFIDGTSLLKDTSIIFNYSITGDLPTNIPTPYVDYLNNTRIIIPTITESETIKQLTLNYQTILEINVLGSDYQFVFCNETGKLYHYESSFIVTVDNDDILSTIDGGDTRFVSLQYLGKLAGFNYIDFIPQTSLPTETPYRLFGCDTSKALSFYTHIAGLPPQRVNREQIARVINNTGEIILKGKVVYINGLDLVDGIGEIELAISDNRYHSERTIGITAHDIGIGEDGIVLRFSFLLNFNTLVFNPQDILYLSDTVAGEITNIRPKAPSYTVKVGVASYIDEFNGVIGIEINSFTGSDTEVNIDGALNGIVLKKPGVRFIVETGIIYCEVWNQNNPTKNLPFIIGGITYFLNTTTNTGNDGYARVPLTAGLDVNTTQTNFVYLYLDNGTPTLAATTIYPFIDFAWIAIATPLDAATTLLDGVQIFQRFNNSIDNGDGNGIFNYLTERIRRSGAQYFTGVDPTITIDGVQSPDSVNITTTSGFVYQLHNQTYDSQDGSVYYVINHPTEPFKKISDLNEIDVDANGDTLLDNGTRFGLNFIGGQNSEGVSDKIYILLPSGSYGNDLDCINDTNNYANAAVPSSLSTTAFRICRGCFRRNTTSGGEYINILETNGLGNFQDERGFPLGNFGGAGAAGISQTTFSDGVFTWFNSADPSKTIQVDLSALTTGSNHIQQFQDKPGIIAHTEDVEARVSWLYPWVANTYPANIMTRIGNFSSISNKTTSDYPVPIAENLPQWSLIPDPIWATNNNIGDIAYGYEFEILEMIDISGWRIWLHGNIDEIYNIQLWDINNINNPILIGSETIKDNDVTGWFEVLNDDEVKFLAFPGSKYRLSVITHSTTNDTEYTGTWTNIDGGEIPTTGIVTLNATAGVKVFIHNNENNAGPDRSADLLLLQEDDNIRFEEEIDSSRFSLYRVAGPVIDQTTYVEIPVELVDVGKNIRTGQSVKTDWIVYGTDTQTDYVEVVNGIPTYFPNGNVVGFFTTNVNDITSPGLVTNNNIYGVDLYGDVYIQSPDWDIISYNNTTGNTGGGGGAEAFGDEGQIQITDGNKNLIATEELFWDLINNKLSIGNPTAFSGKLAVKGDALKDIIAEFFDDVESTVFEILKNGSIKLYETSESIIENGSIWLDASSDYLKLLKDSQEYYLNIDNFINLRDVTWTNPSNGDIAVWNETGLENFKSEDDDRFIDEYAVNISSEQKLPFTQKQGYKLYSAIGDEIGGNDAGDIILSSTQGGNDICAGETFEANEKDIEMTLSETFFSSTQDTELWIRSTTFGSGLVNIKFIFIKIK